MKQFRGIGSVFKGGREIAHVQYSLVKSADPFSALPRTAGFILPLLGQISIGEAYVLRLENGKDLDFFARYAHPHVDDPHATYGITVKGDPEG